MMRALWPIVVLLGVLANVALAQCSAWESVGGGVTQTSGAMGAATAVTTFINGDIVVGGEFARAGGVPCINVALWSGGVWSPMGAGLNGHVHALQTMPDGSVVAGGEFAGGVKRWNGTSWITLGGGVTGPVYGLALAADGSLVVCGSFQQAGLVWASNVARWTGSSWMAMGQTDGTVRAITVLPDGQIAACGWFSTADGVPCNNIAIWSGTQWFAMGDGVSEGSGTYAVVSTAEGDVIATGSYTPPSGLPSCRVSRWRDGVWTQLGPEFNDAVLTLCVLPSGEVLAGGDFTQVGGVPRGKVARWTGTSWASLGAGMSSRVSSLMTSGATIIAGGLFSMAGGELARGVARTTFASLPSFVVGPESQALLPGANAVFEVLAAGPEPRHYQWRRNGADLIEGVRTVGTTTATLTILGVTNADQGGYSCLLTADCGGGPVESPIALLSCEPEMTGQPVSTAILEPGLTLGVHATPGASYTYRWRQNGQNLFNFPGFFSGATTRNLTILTADPSAAGSYDCVVTNACGQTVSSTAMVYCPSDANRDGAVDGDDVILFFQAWDANEIGGDFTWDGAVDGDDVIGFFERWDSGC